MTSCKIYLAGPISGKNWDLEVKPAFKKVENYLSNVGWKVISPVYHEKPPNMGQLTKEQIWVYFMKEALKSLAEADAIYMLVGSDKSEGASLELEIAKALGYAVLYEPWDRLTGESLLP